MKRDYARLDTERRNPRTSRIDMLPLPKVIDLIQAEDAGVARAVRRERGNIIRAVRLIVARLRRGGRIFFVGAGTSGRLGVLEAAEMPPTFGTPPALAQAVMAGGRSSVFASREGAEDRAGALHGLGSRDVVIGIAASGVTPFVQGALRTARKAGAARILVTCSRQGSGADVVIAPQVGPEVIAGSTRLKAGTATKMVLNTLTVAAMISLGKVYGNLMVDLQPRSAKLADRARRIVMEAGGAGPREAARALRAAGGRTKTAIVMARLGIPSAAAERLLRRCGGILRKALSE